MAKQQKYEIVETPGLKQPFHARLRWSNGKLRWTTEQYSQRRWALAVIVDDANCEPRVGLDGHLYVVVNGAKRKIVDVVEEQR